MKEIKRIEERREEILRQMREMRSMERGTITEQYLKVRHKGAAEPVLRGPYYVISRRGERKTEGYRLSGPAELARARRDVEAHQRFAELCREYEELTEALGRLERGLVERAEGKKKRRRSRSSETRR